MACIKHWFLKAIAGITINKWYFIIHAFCYLYGKLGICNTIEKCFISCSLVLQI
jgi:hypothetical protein